MVVVVGGTRQPGVLLRAWMTHVVSRPGPYIVSPVLHAQGRCYPAALLQLKLREGGQPAAGEPGAVVVEGHQLTRAASMRIGSYNLLSTHATGGSGHGPVARRGIEDEPAP